ncbi:MAG: hypothetical protein ACI4IQ_03645 [Eubacterium sp.]
MKTKFSKRILSAFLAVLMVVTTVPAFSIHAFADTSSTGLVGSYLTKDITTGIATNSNVTWDSTEHAAYFDGNTSYLILEGTPMSGVTSEKGFAISFDYKRGSANGDNGRIIDFCDGSTTNTFAVNGGTPNTNQWRRLMTLAKVNGTESSYYTSDFNNSTYCDYTSSNFTDEEQADTWYNVTVSMAPNGQYSYYINGVLRATFKATYDTDYPTASNGLVPSTIADSFSTFTKYYIGTSTYNFNGFSDGYFNGYVKNVKLYDRAVNATQAFAGDASSDLGTLKGAIAEFESRMDGNIYLNMANAYNAYVAACKAYDSYYYGGNTSVDIVTPAANLAAEGYKMHAWIYQPTFTTASYSADDSYDDMLDYYKNVLYADTGLSSDTASATPSGGKVNYYMRAPGATLLYDGGATNPQTAIMVALDGNITWNGRANRYILYVSNSTNNFNLDGYWHDSTGSATSSEKTWNFSWSIHQGTILSNVSSTYSNIKVANDGGSITKYNNYSKHVSNLLVFDNTTNWNGSYLIEVNPSVYVCGASAENTPDTNLSSTLTSSTTVRVINFKPVLDAINNTSNLD